MNPQRVLATAAVLSAVVLLPACGSDDESPGSRSAGTSASASTDAGSAGTGESASTGAGSAEQFESDIEDALEAAGEGTMTDALGKSLSTVLGGATGYEVADGRIYVDIDRSAAENSSGCVIATSARDGVGLTTPISLRYSDETVDCD